jgi:hypothetical protein
LIKLVRKGAHGNRDGHALWGEKGELVFPIQSSRGDRSVRQPVERDVVEDVVPREALRLTVEHACDEPVTAGVVVQYPGGQADGGKCAMRFSFEIIHIRTICLGPQHITAHKQIRLRFSDFYSNRLLC